MNAGGSSSSKGDLAGEIALYDAEAEDEIIFNMLDGGACDSTVRPALNFDAMFDRWRQSFNSGVDALRCCQQKHVLFQAGDLRLGGTGTWRERELSIVRNHGSVEIIHWQEPLIAMNDYVCRIDRFDNGMRGRVVYPSGKTTTSLLHAGIILCTVGVRIRKWSGNDRIELPPMWLRLIDMLNISGGIPPHGDVASDCVLCNTPNLDSTRDDEPLLEVLDEESDLDIRYVASCPVCLWSWHRTCFRSVAKALKAKSTPARHQMLPELAHDLFPQMCAFCSDQFDI